MTKKQKFCEYDLDISKLFYNSLEKEDDEQIDNYDELLEFVIAHSKPMFKYENKKAYSYYYDSDSFKYLEEDKFDKHLNRAIKHMIKTDVNKRFLINQIIIEKDKKITKIKSNYNIESSKEEIKPSALKKLLIENKKFDFEIYDFEELGENQKLYIVDYWKDKEYYMQNFILDTTFDKLILIYIKSFNPKELREFLNYQIETNFNRDKKFFIDYINELLIKHYNKLNVQKFIFINQILSSQKEFKMNFRRDYLSRLNKGNNTEISINEKTKTELNQLTLLILFNELKKLNIIKGNKKDVAFALSFISEYSHNQMENNYSEVESYIKYIDEKKEEEKKEIISLIEHLNNIIKCITINYLPKKYSKKTHTNR